MDFIDGMDFMDGIDFIDRDRLYRRVGANMRPKGTGRTKRRKTKAPSPILLSIGRAHIIRN